MACSTSGDAKAHAGRLLQAPQPSQEHRACTRGKTKDPEWAQCGENRVTQRCQRGWGHGDGRANAGPASQRQTRKAHRTQGAQRSARKRPAQPGAR